MHSSSPYGYNGFETCGATHSKAMVSECADALITDDAEDDLGGSGMWQDELASLCPRDSFYARD